MLEEALRRTDEYGALRSAVREGKTPAALFGLPPSARAQIITMLAGDLGRPAVVVTAGGAEAMRFASDAAFFGAKSAVCPARDLVFRPMLGQSHEFEYRRISAMGNIVGRRCGMLVLPLESALLYTMPRDLFEANTLTVHEGDALRQLDLVTRLLSAGYSRRDRVEGPAQFSVRGGIVDLYPPDMDRPARVEFWGDTVDTMSAFDLLSQRREIQLEKIFISPAREVLFGDPEKASQTLRQAAGRLTGRRKELLADAMKDDLALLDSGVLPDNMDKYLTLRYKKPAIVPEYFEDPIWFFNEPSALREASDALLFTYGEQMKALLERGEMADSLIGCYKSYDELLAETAGHTCVVAESFRRSLNDFPRLGSVSDLPVHELPVWGGEVRVLSENLQSYRGAGYFCTVLAGTPRAAAALAQDLERAGLNAVAAKGDVTPRPGMVSVITGHLSAGADYPFAKFAVITSRRQDEEPQKKRRRRGKGISSLEELKPGDYVVHQNHGIGRYVSIERLDLQGVVKDYIKIQYAGADTLFVPVTQLDLISRYTAPGDSENVRLARLGGTEWAKTTSRVKKATEEMAKELLVLYARRKLAKGCAFPADDDWQRGFESRFEYDETDDQLTAASEIKKDMEKAWPMDRLLCGDVGVGKTEVAMRAAFKAVMGGRQVALLVPTTILAWQHYNTILQRMEAYPVKVGMLSRFSTAKQVKNTISGLRSGTVDIVVGTHRLLQKDVQFRDLGLIIVDEEQRFGVKHKEKLKQSFPGVDVLTLSATPIPRTLSMALSGIRDMSTIEQPPYERLPVETYVLEYDEGVIRQAIARELARGGQVYYLHNRVETIESCVGRVAKMAPGAHIAAAHGKMTEEQLSAVWQSLLDGKTDILVCTTIIETGVDVRNCNTLVIEDADRMGLAQLYQIRGRVGRSDRQAYAYFTFKRDRVLTDIAAKRLSAIREFTAFGSGFSIAMRDLQIRGAGSMLGHSQHGHMEAVGYDMYVKLLNEAVAEQRGEERPPDKSDCLIDVTVDAYIPESYIPDAAGRIEAYKRIAAIARQTDAADVLDELDDRYGEPPASVRGLVEISVIRLTAAKLGIYEIGQQKDTLLFYSDEFEKHDLSPLRQALPGRVRLIQGKKPLLAVQLKTGEKPIRVMQALFDALTPPEQPSEKRHRAD